MAAAVAKTMAKAVDVPITVTDSLSDCGFFILDKALKSSVVSYVFASSSQARDVVGCGEIRYSSRRPLKGHGTRRFSQCLTIVWLAILLSIILWWDVIYPSDRAIPRSMSRSFRMAL